MHTVSHLQQTNSHLRQTLQSRPASTVTGILARMAEKHGITKYTHDGCRCSVCRAAGTAAKRRSRANIKPHVLSESLRPAPKPTAPKVVVALPTSSQPVEAMGINEQSVREECQ